MIFELMRRDSIWWCHLNVKSLVKKSWNKRLWNCFNKWRSIKIFLSLSRNIRERTRKFRECLSLVGIIWVALSLYPERLAEFKSSVNFPEDLRIHPFCFSALLLFCYSTPRGSPLNDFTPRRRAFSSARFSAAINLRQSKRI